MKITKYKGLDILIVIIILLLIALLFIIRALSISGDKNDLLSSDQVQAQAYALELLPDDIMDSLTTVTSRDAECLVVTDSDSKYSINYWRQINMVLDTLCVGYVNCDIALEELPSPYEYRTVIILISDLRALNEWFITMYEYAAEGGSVLLAIPLEPNIASRTLAPKIGVLGGYETYNTVNDIEVVTDFLVGAQGEIFIFDESVYAPVVGLKTEAVLHAATSDGLPLIWEYRYGDGVFVVNNIDTCIKLTRGMFAAEYSLLYECFAWPVINASVFFIDNFPCPLPNAVDPRIQSRYGRDIASFFSSIWWADILDIAKKHDIKYTALMVTEYNKTVSPPFKIEDDIGDFAYYGNMLLKNGGEIGVRGYNLQPLCLSSPENNALYGDNLWPDIDAMNGSFKVFFDTAAAMFPNYTLKAYSPPGNILSAEGYHMIVENFPSIKVISAAYLSTGSHYEQEFTVNSDRIVEFPRIISGTSVNSYNKWAAINELNFHFVNSHFIHSDDVLDTERGAGLGWEKMKSDYSEYISWLNKSASELRQTTVTEGAAAVQRYSVLEVKRDIKENVFTVKADNLYDTAYIFLRFNGRIPTYCEGGTLQKLTSGIYLLETSEESVTVKTEKTDKER